MKNKLTEGEDFYYNEEGLIVLTTAYHLNRGYCCGNSCKHCPYEYINVPEESQSHQNSRIRETGLPKEGFKPL